MKTRRQSLEQVWNRIGRWSIICLLFMFSFAAGRCTHPANSKEAKREAVADAERPSDGVGVEQGGSGVVLPVGRLVGVLAHAAVFPGGEVVPIGGWRGDVRLLAIDVDRRATLWQHRHAADLVEWVAGQSPSWSALPAVLLDAPQGE